MKKIAADRNYRIIRRADSTSREEAAAEMRRVCENMGRRKAIDEALSLLDDWYETYDGSGSPDELRRRIESLREPDDGPYWRVLAPNPNNPPATGLTPQKKLMLDFVEENQLIE